ncbi:MAG: hypothetical protein U0163_07770 [Gemmatimonadaceae bacterium]
MEQQQRLVARVDSASGMVSAIDDGTAAITATVDGKSGSGVVRVFSPVASVAVALALDTLEAYDVRDMQATLRDARAASSPADRSTGRCRTQTSRRSTRPERSPASIADRDRDGNERRSPGRRRAWW